MSGTDGATAYTIGADVPFVDALAAGIRHQAGEAPEALARVRILLPTRRACRSLSEAFGRLSDGAPLLLPMMTPLGDVDEDELAFAGWQDGDAAAGLDLPPAVSGLRRQMLLAALVLANKEQPTTPEQAARLASELGRLLDQMHLERLGFDGLAGLVPDAFADHWQINLRFLRILTDLWPSVLAEEGCIDAAERRNRLLDAQAAAWRAAPPDGPVIAAGSTGSIPATADLLGVVAGLPQGMVVLPGLDRTMDTRTRQGLAPSHPQYGMARLLAHLQIDPDAVADWPAPGVGSGGGEPARIQTVCRALHPGGGSGAGHDLAPMSLPGVFYLECPGPRQEAGVIAIALREALETEGRRAALVTPDRGLARRVQGELARWEIAVDDSAGTPLAKTPPGVFLRLIATMIAEDMAPVPLLAVLKHPLAAGGMAPAAFRAQARRLEVAVLRGPRPAPGGDGLLDAVRRAERPQGKAKQALLKWTRQLADIAAPLADAMARPSVPLAELLAAHVAFAEALAAEAGAADDAGGDGAPRLWAGEAGEAAAGFIAELAEAANRFPPIRGRDYPALLDALMAGRVVRAPYGSHPRLTIWGLLEARLQHADLVILGGLNEGTWPPRTDTGPWMSRPMRADMGLPLPERRIGLAAHDFVQALGAPEVLMTRATRVEGAPTLPCRWLLRLETLLKAEDGSGGLARADRYAGWLADLDEPERIEPSDRPAPKPPVEARPRELSVTRIETWVRDPYALYAEKILGLRPLEPLDADPAAAERGIMVHGALDGFLMAHLDHLPDDAEARLLEIGREIFAAALSRPGVRAFWWPRFERIAHWFIGFEKERRAAGHTHLAPEADGALVLHGPAGPFTLKARADRIDRLGSGGLAVLDYKTGAPPSWPQVECGLAPQLSLEAAIAAAGGFAGVAGETVRQIAYVHLSGGHRPGEMKPYRKDVTELAEKALQGLERRIAAFDRPDTPYLAGVAPMFLSRFGDYDHLARVKEWSAGGGDGE